MIPRMSNLDKWLNIAEKAAYAAGSILTKSSGCIKRIRSSCGHDVKISADIQSEKVLLGILRKKTCFPVLSEEKGMMGIANKEGLVWIIDPLDGSVNFLRGIPLSCISVGLWQNNKPLLGVIYDFNNNELYSGISDKVARCNKKEIRVSRISEKKNAIMCTGFPVCSDFSSKSIGMSIKQVQAYKKVRLLGSAALSLAYVASGRADAYYEKDIMIWDIAAGVALVTGAGGVVWIKPSLKKNSVTVHAYNNRLKL